MRNRPMAAAVSLVLVLLAGCGDDEPIAASDDATAGSIFTDPPAAPPPAPVETTPPPAPETVDACALLTQAEAETLAATPLDPPVAGLASCTWTGPVTGPTAQVEVYVGDGALKILDIDRQLGHVFTELPGIGDEAHLEDGMVFVLVDGTWIGVRLVRLDDPALFAGPLEETARIVADRI
ncbi:hypothetical protein [Jiangella endophytica]|uniref:hypothetical protein n=1 Tax=Jiangella endophytica TaxID=1623398 RepID=UPI000E344A2E|nr:hypothetical protein [Jiangella endophytica]